MVSIPVPNVALASTGSPKICSDASSSISVLAPGAAVVPRAGGSVMVPALAAC